MNDISECEMNTPIDKMLLVEIHECGCIHVRLKMNNVGYLNAAFRRNRNGNKTIWWLMDSRGRPFRTFADADMESAKEIVAVVKPMLERLQGKSNRKAVVSCGIMTHRLTECPTCKEPIWLDGKRWRNIDGTNHKRHRRR